MGFMPVCTTSPQCWVALQHFPEAQAARQSDTGPHRLCTLARQCILDRSNQSTHRCTGQLCCIPTLPRLVSAVMGGFGVLVRCPGGATFLSGCVLDTYGMLMSCSPCFADVTRSDTRLRVGPPDSSSLHAPWHRLSQPLLIRVPRLFQLPHAAVTAAVNACRRGMPGALLHVLRLGGASALACFEVMALMC